LDSSTAYSIDHFVTTPKLCCTRRIVTQTVYKRPENNN
jgi:hypothetical protein